ncbi:MAG: 2-C-methyl-D-erythritol 4-phosphate cytidylyltransferase [Mucinivorans sp.]
MVTTIIVAGGSGQRMGGNVPKQFLEIDGEPILMRVIRNFTYLAGEIIVVLPADAQQMWRELCTKHNFDIEHKCVEGGAQRFDSVANGLRTVNSASEVILVQDGVRPFATRKLIDSIVCAAREAGAAIPVVGVTDTIRSIDGSMIDRSRLMAVQTPQGFRSNILVESYRRADRRIAFTDDASVVEAAGHTVKLIDSQRENIKITTPLDLKIAEILW